MDSEGEQREAAAQKPGTSVQQDRECEMTSAAVFGEPSKKERKTKKESEGTKPKKMQSKEKAKVQESNSDDFSDSEGESSDSSIVDCHNSNGYSLEQVTSSN